MAPRKKEIIEEALPESTPDAYKIVTEADVKLFEKIVKHWTDDEILHVAKRAKIVVPGFKNLQVAPKPFIRKQTSEQIMKKRIFKPMLADMYGDTLKSVQLNTDISYFYTVEDFSTITTSCKLAMMLLQYDAFYNENSDKILINIEREKCLLEGLVDRPEHAQNADLYFTTGINRIKPNWLKSSTGLYDSSFGPFLGEEIKFKPVDFEQRGFGTSLILDRSEIVQHLEHEVARSLLQYTLVEIMELAMDLKTSTTELLKKNDELSAAHEALTAKVDKLTKDKVAAEDEVKRLKAEIKVNARVLKDAERANGNNQATIDKLEAELKAERAKVVEKLILDERVRVVGTQARPDLANYMPGEQITVAKTLTSLKTAMERIRKQQSGLLWFVDLDGLTTKESFEVEQWMRKNQLAYRVVSGSTMELVQRILVDIQGDMQYETN